MRWLPTLSFSPSPSSSATIKSSPSAAALDHHRRKAWLFGNSKKCSARPRKLRHVGDHDAKSPPRWHDSDEDTLVPLSHSPTCIRSATASSVAPQPLPLPELSSAALLRQRDGDCPLPSPKNSPGAAGGGCRGLEDGDRADGAAVDGAPSAGFRMRR